jgi:DNA-binding NtrC family response regulator
MSQPSHILVVDDEPLNLQVFEYNFGDEFPLLYAANATEALAALDAHPVAVIIADHRMPGMLGLDLLALVADRHPTAVRILLTAHTDVPLLVDAVNREVLFRYIAKPWDADGMRQDMQLALSRHAEEIERHRVLSWALPGMRGLAAVAGHVAEAQTALASGSPSSAAPHLAAAAERLSALLDSAEALGQAHGPEQ